MQASKARDCPTQSIVHEVSVQHVTRPTCYRRTHSRASLCRMRSPYRTVYSGWLRSCSFAGLTPCTNVILRIVLATYIALLLLWNTMLEWWSPLDGVCRKWTTDICRGLCMDIYWREGPPAALRIRVETTNKVTRWAYLSAGPSILRPRACDSNNNSNDARTRTGPWESMVQWKSPFVLLPKRLRLFS